MRDKTKLLVWLQNLQLFTKQHITNFILKYSPPPFFHLFFACLYCIVLITFSFTCHHQSKHCTRNWFFMFLFHIIHLFIYFNYAIVILCDHSHNIKQKKTKGNIIIPSPHNTKYSKKENWLIGERGTLDMESVNVKIEWDYVVLLHFYKIMYGGD